MLWFVALPVCRSVSGHSFALLTCPSVQVSLVSKLGGKKSKEKKKKRDKEGEEEECYMNMWVVCAGLCCGVELDF